MFDSLTQIFNDIYDFASNLGALFVLFIAVVLMYVILRNKTITYYIKPSNIDVNFATDVRNILNNSRFHDTHDIKEISDKHADIHIELSPRDKLGKFYDETEYYPGTKKKIWFSFTTQYPKPRIYIDEINWKQGVIESGLTLDQYRQYVIRHEFMHALGYDHQPCDSSTAKNGICPVLYQATRGCPAGFKCGYDVVDADYGQKIKGSYF